MFFGEFIVIKVLSLVQTVWQFLHWNPEMKYLHHLLSALFILLLLEGCDPTGLDKPIAPTWDQRAKDLDVVVAEGLISKSTCAFILDFIANENAGPNIVDSTMTYLDAMDLAVKTAAILDTGLTVRCDSVKVYYLQPEDTSRFVRFFLTLENHLPQDIVGEDVRLELQYPNEKLSISEFFKLRDFIPAHGETVLPPLYYSWDPPHAFEDSLLRQRLLRLPSEPKAMYLLVRSLEFTNGRTIFSALAAQD